MKNKIKKSNFQFVNFAFQKESVNCYRMKTNDWIQMISILYLSIWIISPPFFISEIGRILALSALVIWIITELLFHPTTIFSPSIALLQIYIFIIVSALIIYIYEGMNGLIGMLQTYIFLVFVMIFEGYRRRRILQLRIILWSIILIYPIWLFLTLRAYVTTPNVSRFLAQGGDLQRELSAAGIGGYGLVYSVLLAVPVMIYVVKTSQWFSLKLRLLMLINLILSSLVIIRAGYFIALVLFIVALIVPILIKKFEKKSIIKTTFVTILVIALSPLFSIFLPKRIDQPFENTLYQRKIIDSVDSVDEYRPLGTVSSRTDRYKSSIETFIESPLWGSLSDEGVGGHSAILDRCARFGIIGCMFGYSVLYWPIKISKTVSKDNSFGMTLAVAAVFIILTFTNTIAASFGVVLYILYPAVLSYIITSPQAPCVSMS